MGVDGLSFHRISLPLFSLQVFIRKGIIGFLFLVHSLYPGMFKIDIFQLCVVKILFFRNCVLALGGPQSFWYSWPGGMHIYHFN